MYAPSRGFNLSLEATVYGTVGMVWYMVPQYGDGVGLPSRTRQGLRDIV